MSVLDFSNIIFNYERTKSDDLKSQILEKIKEGNMAPLCQTLSEKYGWDIDQELLSKMKSNNESELKSIEAKIEDAATNAGDTEVIDGLFSKARYFSKIGQFDDAIKVYDEILAKPKTVTGKKIDANMEKSRIAFFESDTSKLKVYIDEAKRLNEVGGDWDRRNRLKIYEAHYLLAVREVKDAAKLLLDCVATFTCTELCTYNQFVYYTLLTNLITLDRNTLRKKIIQDPHVITVIRELPTAQKLVQGIYNCDYKSYFQAIVELLPEFQSNRFLSTVSTFLIREYRVLAYAQFLEAYKSVMLSSMAASFGITVELLDGELSRFIAAGRLNAKIDKVGDIVETRRPDAKNTQYHEIIKKGDLLLNQIQKLVRAVDV